MSKFHFSVIGVLLVIFAGLHAIETVYKRSLPLIELPIKAHNTIGEIPLVSQIDSGGVQDLTPRGRRNWGKIKIHAMTWASCDTVSYVDPSVGLDPTCISCGGWSYQ